MIASTTSFKPTMKFALFLLSRMPMYARMVIRPTITNAGTFNITLQLPIIGAVVHASPSVDAPLLMASSYNVCAVSESVSEPCGGS